MTTDDHEIVRGGQGRTSEDVLHYTHLCLICVCVFSVAVMGFVFGFMYGARSLSMKFSGAAVNAEVVGEVSSKLMNEIEKEEEEATHLRVVEEQKEPEDDL